MTHLPNLKSKLLDMPTAPGVYQFIDANGKILYIGKAKNLKNRLKQYFGKNDTRPQIPFLMKEVTDIHYTVVNNELESLYLERTLIQKHTPKYNIDLRDDKNYAFICFDYSTPIPQIVIKRKLEPLLINPKHSALNAKYFGPYTSTKKIRDLMFTVRKIFGLCSSTNLPAGGGKPCFYFHLHRCPGICAGNITLEEYNEHLEKIKLFLSGNLTPTIHKLKAEMEKLAKHKKFEKASRLRDQFKALQILAEKQNVILTKPLNWDIIGIHHTDNSYGINLFKIRNGKMFDKENFVYQINLPSSQFSPAITKSNQADRQATKRVMQQFLEKYYSETTDIPKEIYIPVEIENKDLIIKLIFNRFAKTVTIREPKKGKAKQLVKLSTLNAQEYLKQNLMTHANYLDQIMHTLADLQTLLHLPTLPQRIECYDISNLQGTNPVGSMVVFENGIPKKSEYRKFKIRINPPAGGPDDFAMIREMLIRRFTHVQTEIQNPKSETNQKSQIFNAKPWPLPDLIVIDGGKGQLNAVLKAFNTQHLALGTKVIALAKRIEEIFLPNQQKPLILPHNNPALQLLQRIRDEAHRFGISFHRQLRSKQAIKSALDDISGIGPKTKKILKRTFGTQENIKKATLEELAQSIGPTLAQRIKSNL